MQSFLKRTIDLVFATFLLIALSPVMLLTSLLILVFNGRPILFSQQRPGLNEKIFTIYKYRTMRNSAAGKPALDKERMTKLGAIIRKTSIDELPQLINIIKGDLSLVGPRPLLVEYLQHYNNRQRKRQSVKPGITGWAQINGRNTISWEQKFEYDIWYVENWTLGLDFKIMLLTFIKLIKPTGINASNDVTMEKFKGTENV